VEGPACQGRSSGAKLGPTLLPSHQRGGSRVIESADTRSSSGRKPASESSRLSLLDSERRRLCAARITRPVLARQRNQQNRGRLLSVVLLGTDRVRRLHGSHGETAANRGLYRAS
jgi:hypothetical protein